MDQQLKQALELHQQKKTDEALPVYEAILKRKEPPIHAFLNASSIWRQQQKQEKSIKCLKRGLSNYPSEPGLWNNLGNCYMDTGAIVHAVCTFRKALTISPSFTDARISLASCLRTLGHPHIAYAAVKNYFCETKDEEERQRLLIPLVEAILSLATSDSNIVGIEQIEPIAKIVETEIRKNIGQGDPCRASLVMTQLWIQVDEIERAIASREKLVKEVDEFFTNPDNSKFSLKDSFHKTWHSLNWNLAIQCLKKGRLDIGWTLYEHGLQVGAEGPQRWQRALRKPFTPSEVSLWRGSR